MTALHKYMDWKIRIPLPKEKHDRLTAEVTSSCSMHYIFVKE